MSTLTRVLIFGLALTLVFTAVANYLPQVEGERPAAEEALDLGALTMDAYVALGERLVKGKGTCTLCHNNLGRAPDLLAENVVASARQRLADPGYRGTAADAEGYLRESMLEPSAYVVPGFGKKGSNDTLSPMPAIDRAPIELSALEIGAVVAFLQAKDGNEITVALPAGEPAPAAVDSAVVAADPPPPAATAEEALQKYACSACHAIAGSSAAIGPNLTDVGSRLDVAAIRESVVEPGKVVAVGFPPIMPPDFADRMNARELELVVAYLSQQKAPH